ncbi:MAG: glycoside hydrolase family 3 C-terminal domain-containing protein, partial [Burkholderiales bacterium]|nr:glycoside hydrolase family 3 C-terminal domain-containing protein [Opitutaceae bacterium]
LGIPQFTGSDGPHGIGNESDGWSSFPVTLAMTATWDPALIHRVGRAIALEQASRGRHRLAGPTLDLLHDPRNGRAPETIGEDPFLGGRISEGFLRGMAETPVFATIKHYNLNTFEANRETNDYLVDSRSLVEFWGAHWRRAIQDGAAQSVMCAYNLVNGEKSAENYTLIRTLLRDHWGFRGYTMCDWGGFWSTEKAMAGELDFCEGNELYFKELPGLVAAGKITPAQLDLGAGNVLRTKLLAGMMDHRPPNSEDQIRDSAAHRDLVYESGLKSIVLLKNQANFLPLSPAVRSVAVIGPNSGVLPLDGHSSSAVRPTYTVTPLEGISAIVGADKVTHAAGCAINSTDRAGFAEALRIAREAEVVVFVGGLDQTVEGEGHYIKGDRIGGSTLLPGVQNELIQAVAAVNPNVVLVVISGGPCAVSPVLDQVKGLFYAPYPGQEGGRALADLLFGRANPSGKLPVTIPHDDAQLPPVDNDFRDPAALTIGYRWYDSQKLRPDFAFGHGLSYTTFKYRRLTVAPTRAAVGQPVTVEAEVINTGARAGEEVVQLYVSTGKLAPSVVMPVKQLRGFQKIALEPGQRKRVTFTLTPEELYVYDPATATYGLPAGDYRVAVGGASDVLPLTGRFALAPAAPAPDLQIVNLRTLPAFPLEGDPVLFLASVVNRGTAPLPAGASVSVMFQVDGKTVSTSPLRLTEAIPSAGMSLVCGSEGVTGSPAPLTAPAGTFELRAEVDAAQATPETIETNNVRTERRSIPVRQHKPPRA